MTRPQCTYWSLIAVTAGLALSGCNSRIPTYPTQGKVVYKADGKPVTGGVIVWFESTTPPYHRSSSDVDSEGRFSLGFIQADSGAIEGEHRIRFAPSPPFFEKSEDALAKRMHPRYHEFSTSGLKQTIVKGKNEVVIEVEGPAER